MYFMYFLYLDLFSFSFMSTQNVIISWFLHMSYLDLKEKVVTMDCETSAEDEWGGASSPLRAKHRLQAGSDFLGFKQIQIFLVLHCCIIAFFAFFYVYVAQDIHSSNLALDFYHSSCVLNPQGLFRVVNMEDPDRGPLENHLVFWWVKRHPIDYEDGPDDDNGLSVMMMVCQWWRWFVGNDDGLSMMTMVCWWWQWFYAIGDGLLEKMMISRWWQWFVEDEDAL